jgi:hypothetical protein
MKPAVQRLLQRLASVASAAALVNETHSVFADLPTGPNTRDGDGRVSAATASKARPKLVYGQKRQGAVRLADHQSHSSHASHSSHYSGAGGGDYVPAPVQPAPATPTQSEIWSAVLQKLPRIRSRWPNIIVLKRATYFTILDGTQQVGFVSLNTGTKLHLIDIKPEHALVMVSDTVSPVPVENTDLVDQLGGMMAVLALTDDPAPPSADPNPNKGSPPPPTLGPDHG